MHRLPFCGACAMSRRLLLTPVRLPEMVPLATAEKACDMAYTEGFETGEAEGYSEGKIDGIEEAEAERE